MVAFQVAFLIACFLAAFWDFLLFKIPNELVLFIIALFVAKIVLFGKWDQALMPVGIFFATLVLGYGLFLFKVAGAGDVKFIAACSLWTAPEHFGLFLLVMGLAGGVLGLLYYFWAQGLSYVRMQCMKPLEGLPFLKGVSFQEEQNDGVLPGEKKKVFIPYGVAVFVGAAAAMLVTV